MKAYMYILECADGSYYTGSTTDLEARVPQHQNGEGANYTKNNLPVKLVYFEEYDRIDEAFYREKQVQGWSRKKKQALINGQLDKLPGLAKNYTQFAPSRPAPSTGAGTGLASIPDPRRDPTPSVPELVEGVEGVA
jgi:putative endonuclease